MTHLARQQAQDRRARVRHLQALVREGKVLLIESTDAAGNWRVEAIPQPNLQGAG